MNFDYIWGAIPILSLITLFVVDIRFGTPRIERLSEGERDAAYISARKKLAASVSMINR